MGGGKYLIRCIVYKECLLKHLRYLQCHYHMGLIMVMQNSFPLGHMKKGLDMVQSFNSAKNYMALSCSGDEKITCWYLSSIRCVLPSRRH